MALEFLRRLTDPEVRVQMTVAAIGSIAAALFVYLFLQSHNSPALPPIVVSPVQTVQQSVQVMAPGASGAGASAGAAANPAPAPSATPRPTGTADTLTFEVRACRRTSADIRCDVLVTSPEDGVELMVSVASNWDGTRALDSAGIVLFVTTSSFAGMPSYSGTLKAKLAAHQPTPLELHFDSMNAASLQAIYLQIALWSKPAPASDWHSVIIRDVKIEG